jgi:predicted nucleotidyltransferase/predicted transcriptional regulator
MRISQPITKILNSALKVDILRLFCRTGKEMNGREIARELNATAVATHKALKELASEGILIRRNAGRLHLYSIRQQAWITEKLLKPLFQEEDSLEKGLIAAIQQGIKASKLKDEILSVAVFGSVYLGQEGPSSDVDLMVVIKDGHYKSQVEDLIFAIDKETFPKVGLSLEPHVNSLTEFKKKYNDNMELIKNVLKTNKVYYGQNLEVLI